MTKRERERERERERAEIQTGGIVLLLGFNF